MDLYVHIYIYIFLILTWGLLFIDLEREEGRREREGERERDNERHWCKRKLVGCLLHVPQPDIKPATSWCTGRCSNQLRRPATAAMYILNVNGSECLLKKFSPTTPAVGIWMVITQCLTPDLWEGLNIFFHFRITQTQCLSLRSENQM